MKKIFTLFILFLPIIVLAQSTLSGKIVDDETGKPIEFASIYTRLSGTISNELGEFVLKTDSDTLFISHLSYLPMKVAVTGEVLNIELKARAITMEAAVIRPYGIIHGVYEKYSKIYKHYDKQDKEFPKATFYYRQTTFQDSLNTEFTECFFNGNVSTKVGDLSIKHGRYAKVMDTTRRIFHFSNAYILSQLSPITFFKFKKNRSVTPLCHGWSRIFDINLESRIDADTADEICIYRFIPKKKQEDKYETIIGGSLHIRRKDSTIVKFVGESELLALNVSFGVKILSKKLNLTIIYKDSEPFPIVESIKMQLEIRSMLNSKMCNLRINTTMYATEYNIEALDSKTHLEGDLLRSLAKHKYDPIFWRDNPVIKRTPIENKTIAYFTQLGYFGNFDL